MKGEILKLLKESDGYLSGQELCERFGVSRTAVWKVINQLKEEGYEIEAVRNKGYILKSVSDVLSKEELESSLKTRWAGKEILLTGRIPPTSRQDWRGKRVPPTGPWRWRRSRTAAGDGEEGAGSPRQAWASG